MNGIFRRLTFEDNTVVNLKVKVFETFTTKNGKYTIMKGVVGSKRGKDGKFSGGMKIDVMIPSDLKYTVAKNGTYHIDGRLSWSTNEGKDGKRYTDCTVWAVRVKPYEWRG